MGVYKQKIITLLSVTSFLKEKKISVISIYFKREEEILSLASQLVDECSHVALQLIGKCLVEKSNSQSNLLALPWFKVAASEIAFIIRLIMIDGFIIESR